MRTIKRISPKKRLSTNRFLILISFLIISTLSIIEYNDLFEHNSKIISAEGGTITESTIGKIKNLSPFAVQKSVLDWDLQKLIFEGLLRYDSIDGQIQNALGTLQIKDPQNYTITIKDNARFQDGTTVTLDDVLFTYESIIQNPHFDNPVLFDAFKYVSLEVVDKKTINFKLVEPNFFFPHLLTTPIVPEKYFQNIYIEDINAPLSNFNKHPIGAGPYLFEKIIPEKNGRFQVHLERNPFYYAGIPKVKKIIYFVYPNIESLNKNYISTTIFSHLPTDKLASIKEKINNKEITPTEYKQREYLLPRFLGLFFNLDSKTSSSLNLRNALDLSLNKELVLKNNKEWTVLNSFFFFQGIDSQHEYDPLKARNTLKTGGFPYNEELKQRTRGSDGELVELNMLTSTNPPLYSRFAHNIKNIWEKELQIKVNLEILPPNEFEVALKKRDYDVILFGENYSKNVDTLSTWHSSQTDHYNLSNLTNSSIDFLINEIKATGSQTDLNELNKELKKLTPAIILATPKYNLFVSEELKKFNENFGGKPRSHADKYNNIQDWYFFETKSWDLTEKTTPFEFFIKSLLGL